MIAVRRTCRRCRGSAAKVVALLAMGLVRRRTVLELSHRGRLYPAVVGRRRGQLPFQSQPIFPDRTGGFDSAVHTLPDQVDKQKLRGSEKEAADRGHHVPIGELRGVVGYPSRHASEPKEVLRKEQYVKDRK